MLSAYGEFLLTLVGVVSTAGAGFAIGWLTSRPLGVKARVGLAARIDDLAASEMDSKARDLTAVAKGHRALEQHATWLERRVFPVGCILWLAVMVASLVMTAKLQESLPSTLGSLYMMAVLSVAGPGILRSLAYWSVRRRAAALNEQIAILLGSAPSLMDQFQDSIRQNILE